MRNAPALNALFLLGDVPMRVWFNNPEPRDGVWLVAPNGRMQWWDNAMVLNLVEVVAHPDAFPVADPVAAPLALAA